MNFETVNLCIKLLKLLLNLTILILYWYGANGYVLGIEGVWTSRAEISAIEILAICVFGGYFVGSLVVAGILCRSGLKNWKLIFLDAAINLLGFVMYLVLGILTLKFWTNHSKYDENDNSDEKDEISINYAYRKRGIVLGALCVVEAVIYFADSVLGTWCFVLALLKRRWVGAFRPATTASQTDVL